MTVRHDPRRDTSEKQISIEAWNKMMANQGSGKKLSISHKKELKRLTFLNHRMTAYDIHTDHSYDQMISIAEPTLSIWRKT
jgi:hypothetical protein